MDNKKTMRFEIATPERVVLKKEAKQITIPTTEGEITVLPKHSPLIAILKPGVIEAILEDDSTEIMAVAGGFVNILKSKVVILADSAQRGEELDERAVEEAKKRADEYKSKVSSQDQVEYTEIAVKLERELAKLRAANKWRRLNNISKK
jgi:F-type H+-transporting ATPase subunit epsilon